MKVTVTPCARCRAPMLPASVLDKNELLAQEYRRPAPNGYICTVCQHDRPQP